MKMIRAIVRPEAADGVAEGLAEAGFFSLTKIHVFGRGKQKGHHSRDDPLRRTSQNDDYDRRRR